MSVPFTYSGSHYCLRIENGLIVALGSLTTDKPGRLECVKISSTGNVIRTGAGH
ncbi:MAG: hypothetical protein WCL18_11015 [bacterium]